MLWDGDAEIVQEVASYLLLYFLRFWIRGLGMAWRIGLLDDAALYLGCLSWAIVLLVLLPWRFAVGLRVCHLRWLRLGVRRHVLCGDRACALHVSP